MVGPVRRCLRSAPRPTCQTETVEAICGTKAGLLEAVVEYAIRGGVQPASRGAEARRDRCDGGDARRGDDARAPRRPYPSRHCSFGTHRLGRRTGRPGRSRVAQLWKQMNDNRRVGVDWATRTLLAKPDVIHLDVREAETVFWIALDRGACRVLTEQVGLGRRRVRTLDRRLLPQRAPEGVVATRGLPSLRSPYPARGRRHNDVANSVPSGGVSNPTARSVRFDTNQGRARSTAASRPRAPSRGGAPARCPVRRGRRASPPCSRR